MRSLSLLLALLMCSLSLAGCASNSSTQSLATDVAFEDVEIEVTEETGVIRGVIVDAAIQPIGGVSVTAVGASEETTKTNDLGAFVIQGIAGGTYDVRAEKEGYLSAHQVVDVTPGIADPDVIKFLLEVDAESVPYITPLKFDGFIECSFSLVVVRFAACSSAPSSVSNDEFLVEYPMDMAPWWVQSEVIWESTQSLGDEMQLSVTDFGGSAQKRIAAEAGESPLLLVMNGTLIAESGLGTNVTGTWRVFNDGVDSTDVWPDEEAQEAWATTVYPVWNSTAPDQAKDAAKDYYSEECIKYPAVFDACLGLGSIGATINQEFTMFTHVFYNMMPDEGWRFTADGEHPY